MKPQRKGPKPTSFSATGPNQGWSWDISYCPSEMRGQQWYLYLIMDIYSRKIVAWEILEAESRGLAKKLIDSTLISAREMLTKPTGAALR